MSINILIIEDVNNKITSLGKAIKAKAKVEVNIFPEDEEMDNFITTLSNAANESTTELYNWSNDTLIKYLDDNDIDLIILDFYLYKNEESDNGRVDGASGYKILEKIRNSNVKNIPIFANSFKNNDLVAINDNILSTIDGILEKKSTKSEYEGYFSRNIFLINRMVALAESYKKEKIKSDIVVVCALKKEIKPVLSLLEDKIEENETFGIGYIKDKNDKKLKVVAITKEQMGMAEAATLTTQMIGKYNPTYVVMTGIAGGIDIERQNFLDVLMPSYIHNWQSGKFKQKNEADKILHVFEREYSSVKTYIEEKPDLNINEDDLHKIPENFLKEENFEGNFDVESIQQYLLEIKEKEFKKRSEFKRKILKLYENDEQKIKKGNKTDKEKIPEKLNNKLSQLLNNNSAIDFIKNMKSDLPCDIQKDGMVSGSAVVADEYVVSESIANRKINGIDMEAYGVVYACNQHPRKPKVLILKAICDFADNNKNDIYQSAAAYVSAQVFYKLFTKYIDMEAQS